MAPMLASSTGVMMFVVAAFSVMLGYWMMMKIADIDI
jgi:Flp pilus assembly protein TadB